MNCPSCIYLDQHHCRGHYQWDKVNKCHIKVCDSYRMTLRHRFILFLSYIGLGRLKKVS